VSVMKDVDEGTQEGLALIVLLLLLVLSIARVCAGCVLAMAPAYAQCWRSVSHMALAICVRACRRAGGRAGGRACVCARKKTSWGGMAETLDQSESALRGRCLHLEVMPLCRVWKVPFSGESIHL
jgi:cobalamin synthase